MASPLMRVYVLMSTVPRGWHDPQENFDAMAADGGSLEHSQLHHIFLRYTSSWLQSSVTENLPPPTVYYLNGKALSLLKMYALFPVWFYTAVICRYKVCLFVCFSTVNSLLIGDMQYAGIYLLIKFHLNQLLYISVAFLMTKHTPDIKHQTYGMINMMSLYRINYHNSSEDNKVIPTDISWRFGCMSLQLDCLTNHAVTTVTFCWTRLISVRKSSF